MAEGRDSPYLIVFDLGSSGGRVYLGWLEKVASMPRSCTVSLNGPVRIGDAWYWGILRVYDEVLIGLRRAAARIGSAPALIGVDSYGVDYAYIDASGALLSPMRHMRDPRTDGAYDAIHALIPKAELYRRTGAMTISINTLAQLFAERRTQPWLQDSAQTLLFTPDLINYFLTGERVSDLTIASTSQMIDPGARAWAPDVLARLGLPAHFLGPLVEPGREIAPLRPALQRETGLGPATRVVAVAGHDTAAAVAATPFEPGRKAAFVSLGTWSLIGRETNEPDLSDASLAANITNECGVGGRIVYHKILSGLWLLQECRRIWAAEDPAARFRSLARRRRRSAAARFRVRSGRSAFPRSRRHAARDRRLVRRPRPPAPASRGEMTRAIYDNLALNFRCALDTMPGPERAALDAVHVVGGGARSPLLCQATADAAGVPVIAGPVEATVAGNMLCQLLAAGMISNLEEGRAIVRRSYGQTIHEPQRSGDIERAYETLLSLKAAGSTRDNPIPRAASRPGPAFPPAAGELAEPRDHGVAVPVRRALPKRQRRAVGPDDQRRRVTARPDFRPEPAVRVEIEPQALEAHPVEQGLRRRRADRVLRHRDDREVVFRQAGGEPVERGHLLEAGHAPWSPEIEDEGPAPEQFERDDLASLVEDGAEPRRLPVQEFDHLDAGARAAHLQSERGDEADCDQADEDRQFVALAEAAATGTIRSLRRLSAAGALAWRRRRKPPRREW